KIGEIRADALDEVQRHDRESHESKALFVGKNLIENRFDQPGQPCRGNGVDHHRHHRPSQAAPVGLCVPKKPKERVHSLKRYLSSTQSATTPSRQVIFLPSSYPRPS